MFTTPHQQTITFAEPIDALSITMQPDTNVQILLENGWHTFFIEEEFDPTLRESDLVMFPKSIDSVVLKGDIRGVTLNPIRVSTEPATYEIAAQNFYRAPRILARRDWGADDTFLYRGPDVTRSDEPAPTPTPTPAPSYTSQGTRQDDCKTAQVNYPQDFKTARTVTHLSNGERLRWARRYSPDVKLLVVHHTAQTVNGDKRPAIERVRALYEYHANSRGWGDVGYHYLVDENGGIYEGRSGGDSVVGGHVYCGNVGTVGVALLGNFDIEQPSVAQVQALQWLLDHLATKYNIDVSRTVSFKGKAMSPIVGHKDLISTECPGYYMSSAMNQVRRNVQQGELLAAVNFPKLPTTTTPTSRRESRLASRLQEAGQQLSRSYYRAKRLVRTASRTTRDTRLQALEEQRTAGSNIQRLRSARQMRLLARRRPTQTLTTRTTPTPSAPSTTPEGHIRIRLSYTGNNARITLNGETISLGKEGSSCVGVRGNTTVGEGVVRLGSADTIATIASWNTLNNRFRGVIECRIVSGEFVLINELSLEDYMAGLSEEPDTELFEKQKAFAVAARSYAAHYTLNTYRKFPGKPYDGNDSPAVFQKYSGVNFEEKNPRWVQAVQDTNGLVLKVGSDILKAAYYSSNDGRTRSPAENGWQNFPHAKVFVSKPDPWCEGLELRGHGVGMSGCGAKGQAAEGKSYTEILQYYYPGTTLASR